MRHNPLKGWIVPALLLATLGSTALAVGGEVGGIVAGATAEGRVQDDTLFGGGQDLVTVNSPEIGYQLRGPDLNASLRYDADLYQYIGQSPETNTNQRSYLHLKDRLGTATTLAADGTLQYVTDPLALDRLGVPRTNSPVIFSSTALEGDERLGKSWIAKLGYQFQLAHFEDPSLIDGSVHAPWASIGYQLDAADELSLRERYQLFLKIASPSGSADTASLAWSHRIGSRLRTELEAGPIYYIDPTGAPAWTPYGVAGAIYRLRHGEVELRAGRDLVGATGFGTALWAEYVQAGVESRLGRRWTGRVGATYFVDGLAPAAVAAVSGYGGEAALDFRPGRDWTVEAAVDRIGQTSAAPGTAALDLGIEVVAMRLTYQWGSDKRLR